MTAPVIHINGWPGSGKLTIATALAHLIQGRVLHNHLMLDAAGAVFHRGTPEHAKLRKQVTSVLLDAARNLPANVPVIATNAFADTPADWALFEPFQCFAKDRGAGFFPVTLAIDLDENCTRLTDPSRGRTTKLTDPDYLAELRKKHRLLSPEGSQHIDVTHLSATDAALSIQAELVREDG